MGVEQRSRLGISAVMERIQHRWACVPMLLGPIHVAAVVMMTPRWSAPFHERWESWQHRGITSEEPSGADDDCGVTEAGTDDRCCPVLGYRNYGASRATASPTSTVAARGLPVDPRKFTSPVHRLKGARACPG